MLIICHDAWIANMQPFVDHKNAIGITTTIVGVSTIGNDSVAIKNYIQGVYDTSDLAFVLLVGDVGPDRLRRAPRAARPTRPTPSWPAATTTRTSSSAASRPRRPATSTRRSSGRSSTR